ncbi:hypothetical protein os1_36660 [Comamonadaceae bacterium OS-1]|nr:hypothetical protein os1_36660 [Comamonadaceae bacterium OS-1]
MRTSLEILEAEVLQLTPAHRAHLLEKLIASLDVDPDVEAAWDQVADQREAAVAAGNVIAVPGQEAMARLRARWPA